MLTSLNKDFSKAYLALVLNYVFYSLYGFVQAFRLNLLLYVLFIVTIPDSLLVLFVFCAFGIVFLVVYIIDSFLTLINFHYFG